MGIREYTELVKSQMEKERLQSLLDFFEIEESDINAGWCGHYAAMLALELEKHKIDYRIYLIPYVHTWIVVNGECYDYGLLNGKPMNRKIYMDILDLDEYDFQAGVQYSGYPVKELDVEGRVSLKDDDYPRPEFHWVEESGYISLSDYLLRIATPYDRPYNGGFFDDEIDFILKDRVEYENIEELKKKLFYNEFKWLE